MSGGTDYGRMERIAFQAESYVLVIDGEHINVGAVIRALYTDHRRLAREAAAQEAQMKELEADVAHWRSARDGHFNQAMKNGSIAQQERSRAETAETALAAERAKVAKLVEYYEASEAILSIEAEWRSRKADGLLDGSNIFNLTDKLTAAEARLAKARAAITEAGHE